MRRVSCRLIRNRTQFQLPISRLQLGGLSTPSAVLSVFESLNDCTTSQSVQMLRRLITVIPKSACDPESDPRYKRMMENVKLGSAALSPDELACVLLALSTLQDEILCGDSCRGVLDTLCQVVKSRMNAISPSGMALIAFAVSRRSSDTAFRDLADHIHSQVSKYVNEFEPRDLWRLLEFHRKYPSSDTVSASQTSGVFSRSSFDSICERLGDEAERLTPTDLYRSFQVIAALGVPRGFTIKRLSSLCLAKMSSMSSVQLCGLAESMSKLRCHTSKSMSDILHHINVKLMEPIGRDQSLHLSCALELVHAVALNYEHSCVDEVVRLLQDTLGSDPNSAGGISQLNKVVSELSVGRSINLAWALMSIPQLRKWSVVGPLVGRILDSEPSGCIKTAHDVLVFASRGGSDAIRSKLLSDSGQRSLAKWRAAYEAQAPSELRRLKNSRLMAEINLRLTELEGKYGRFDMQSMVEEFRVGWANLERKKIVEIDLLGSASTPSLRTEALSSNGYNSVVVNYWQFVKCKTSDEQRKYLDKLLSRTGEALERSFSH